MKKLAKQMLLGLLVLVLTLSLVACGGDGETTTTTTTTEGDDSAVTTTVADTDATTTTGDGKQSSTTKSNTTKPGTTKPNTDKASSLTWAQVKAKMPANLNGSTIVFYNWNELNSITDAQKVANAFTKETGIKLEWKVGGYSTYTTEIAAMQAAKSAPDIIRMKDNSPALMKLLQPLSNTGYDFNDNAWDQALMKQYSYNGKAYATNMANTLMQQPDVLLYNKKLIDKYDLEDPYVLWKNGKWTYDKMVEICQDYKDAAGEGNIAYSPHKWPEFAQVQGVDFAVYTENGWQSNATDPKLADGIRKMIRMKQDGFINGSYKLEGFEGGTVLFFHDAIIGARKTHFYFTNLKNDGSLGIVPLAKIGNSYAQLYAELEAYAIPAGAKNAAAVPYFLRYWLDADNYNANTFFANRTVLEVYNHCMKDKNRFVTSNYTYIMTADNGLSTEYGAVLNGAEANVASHLNSIKNQIVSACKLANQDLDKSLK